MSHAQLAILCAGISLTSVGVFGLLRRRVDLGCHASAINRPHFMVLVDGDDCCVLAMHWGNGNSDPVWYVDLILSGTLLGRWIARAYWLIRERLDRRKARA